MNNYRLVIKHYNYNIYFSVYTNDNIGIIAEVPFCKNRYNEYEMKETYVYNKHMFNKDILLKQLFKMELITKSINDTSKLILTETSLLTML